jgi:hypothetical protein
MEIGRRRLRDRRGTDLGRAFGGCGYTTIHDSTAMDWRYTITNISTSASEGLATATTRLVAS